MTVSTFRSSSCSVRSHNGGPGASQISGSHSASGTVRSSRTPTGPAQDPISVCWGGDTTGDFDAHARSRRRLLSGRCVIITRCQRRPAVTAHETARTLQRGSHPRVTPAAEAFSLRSRRPQVRILSGAPTLQALFPQEKGLFSWVFRPRWSPLIAAGRCPDRVPNGQKPAQKAPFEHQKLPEKLPSWRPSLGRRAGTSRGSCARASGASESASTTARCTRLGSWLRPLR